ncbi:hypothetical protein [Catenuloplanes indicus]|uniref:Uncharacterized protein n=1 Tax=Catenuloplanes indicus TaxID=137267 RepID=A0AAE3W050_9ACTN|nr:hypothetical protein [Catenuloplanes indicus]MDQ0366875.1 hypothetical protein [Catenuloplanes indicus]
MSDQQPLSPRHLAGDVRLSVHREGATTVERIPGLGSQIELRNMGGDDMSIVVRSGNSQAENPGPSGWRTRRDENILTWPALLRTINEADPSHLDPKLNELRALIDRATTGAA